MEKLFKFTVMVMLLVCSWFGAYDFGANSIDTEPESDFIWINNDRYHTDSIITVKAIYDDLGVDEIGCYIRVEYNGSMNYIECYDTADYTWMEYRDSFLMVWRGLDGIQD